MRTRLRAPRGGAAVETAVLMIVLMPLIMYTLFLEDLLAYKLDEQETVVSVPWDLLHHDYMKNSSSDILGQARQAGMQTYWDHTSAWNTYSNPNHDAQDKDHHQALAAHQCWLAQGGEEVACEWENSTGVLIEPKLMPFNKGGKVTCHAILGVENYFLPQQLFQWWGRNPLTKQKRHTSDDIHGNAASDPYTFPKEYFSVLHDPWALNHIKNTNPMSHPSEMAHPFFLRENVFYQADRNTDKAIDFVDGLIDDEILTDQAKYDGMGDNIEATPPLAWKEDPEREFSSHYTSAWSDSRHEGTQGAMSGNDQPGQSYMGLPSSRW